PHFFLRSIHSHGDGRSADYLPRSRRRGRRFLAALFAQQRSQPRHLGLGWLGAALLLLSAAALVFFLDEDNLTPVIAEAQPGIVLEQVLALPGAHPQFQNGGPHAAVLVGLQRLVAATHQFPAFELLRGRVVAEVVSRAECLLVDVLLDRAIQLRRR